MMYDVGLVPQPSVVSGNDPATPDDVSAMFSTVPGYSDVINNAG